MSFNDIEGPSPLNDAADDAHEIARLRAEVARLTRERDEARKYAEDVAQALAAARREGVESEREACAEIALHIYHDELSSRDAALNEVVRRIRDRVSS